ncbi:MAG: hypothetical protein OXN25_04460 [Candidatus Poribacteria bacterium]|nr:hypothetical protein [Candidatus Poribacteria bacterium]
MSNRISGYFKILTFQVWREQLLEVEAGIAERRFHRTFAASSACGNVSNRDFFNVV